MQYKLMISSSNFLQRKILYARYNKNATKKKSVAFALKQLTATEEARIAALLKKAV